MRLTEDEIVASLPPWTTQITLRACVVGVVLGVLFQFVTMRFALGPGGVVPTFNMPMGAMLTRARRFCMCCVRHAGAVFGLQAAHLRPSYGERCYPALADCHPIVEVVAALDAASLSGTARC